jgi:hypothetical protein
VQDAIPDLVTAKSASFVYAGRSHEDGICSRRRRRLPKSRPEILSHRLLEIPRFGRQRVEAPRPALSDWQVKALREGEKPETSGDGAVMEAFG